PRDLGRPWGRLAPPAGGVVAAALFLTLLWVYWPTLGVLVDTWRNDSRSSHGYLVPVFSLYLLWARRARRMGPPAPAPSWWGLPVLLAGLALRAAGTWFYLDWFRGLSLLPCLAGLALLGGGRPALTWAWPAVAFAAFMLPLPYRVEVALAHP